MHTNVGGNEWQLDTQRFLKFPPFTENCDMNNHRVDLRNTYGKIILCHQNLQTSFDRKVRRTYNSDCTSSAELKVIFWKKFIRLTATYLNRLHHLLNEITLLLEIMEPITDKYQCLH